LIFKGGNGGRGSVYVGRIDKSFKHDKSYNGEILAGRFWLEFRRKAR
jgi:hypothetical protein